MPQHLNEDASAGAMMTFILALGLIGLIIVFMGPLVDKVIIAGAYGTLGTVISADRIDTLNLLLLSWKAIPFVILFAWGLWYLKTQLEKVPGVD